MFKHRASYNEYQRDLMRKRRGTPQGRGKGRPKDIKSLPNSSNNDSVRPDHQPASDETDCQPNPLPDTISLYGSNYSKEEIKRALDIQSKPFIPVAVKNRVSPLIKAAPRTQEDIDAPRL